MIYYVITFIVGGALGLLSALFVASSGQMNKILDAYQNGYQEGISMRADDKKEVSMVLEEVERLCNVSMLDKQPISKEDFNTISILLKNAVERM